MSAGQVQTTGIVIRVKPYGERDKLGHAADGRPRRHHRFGQGRTEADGVLQPLHAALRLFPSDAVREERLLYAARGRADRQLFFAERKSGLLRAGRLSLRSERGRRRPPTTARGKSSICCSTRCMRSKATYSRRNSSKRSLNCGWPRFRGWSRPSAPAGLRTSARRGRRALFLSHGGADSLPCVRVRAAGGRNALPSFARGLRRHRVCDRRQAEGDLFLPHRRRGAARPERGRGKIFAEPTGTHLPHAGIL